MANVCCVYAGTTGLGALENYCCFVGMEKDRRRFFGALHILAARLAEQLEKSG